MKIKGERLKEILANEGISKSALAFITGLSDSTIHRMCKGTCSPITLFKVCSVLRITPAELIISTDPILTLKYIHATPYLEIRCIGKLLNVSNDTLHTYVQELKMWDCRYGNCSVIEDMDITLINIICILDYMKYRHLLSDKNNQHLAPPFDPYQWAHAMGWYESYLNHTTNNTQIYCNKEEEL